MNEQELMDTTRRWALLDNLGELVWKIDGWMGLSPILMFTRKILCLNEF